MSQVLFCITKLCHLCMINPPTTNFFNLNNDSTAHPLISFFFPLQILSFLELKMAAAETLLKTGQVSTMIKQGFIRSPPLSLSPPNSTTPTSHPSPNNNTLFHMLTQETQPHPNPVTHHPKKIRDHLGERPNWGPADLELLICSNDGVRVSMEVHGIVLVEKSGFFKEKLMGRVKGSGVVEIRECDDVEVYVEVVSMMYDCKDLRRRLFGEEIGRVLALLKVSSAIMFSEGVVACLDYLEAIPWSEDQEEEIISVISHLELPRAATGVLQRVSVEPSTSSKTVTIISQLLSGVLQAKDEKARKDMKSLISGLLGENNKLDVSMESFYRLCHKCLDSLHLCMSEAATIDDSRRDRGNLMGEIAREADNVHWLIEILIQKGLADEFVMLWADQTQLASLHSKIPCMYRFEISRITAQFCIAIGKGEILVSNEAKFSLLKTWLDALYNDFGWMRRACRTLDKSVVEDSLCKTILTLPMSQQQTILMRWLDRFLKKGDDCPNLQRAFEVWWRRKFVRKYKRDCDRSRLEIAFCDYPK